MSDSLENIGCFGVCNDGPRNEIWKIAEKPNLSDDEKTLLKHLLWLSDVRNSNQYGANIKSNVLYAIKMMTNNGLIHVTLLKKTF